MGTLEARRSAPRRVGERKEFDVDITISARRCTINESLREDVEQRLTDAIDKIGGRAIRAEVEFTGSEASKGVSATRCEITLRGKGPVVRGAGVAEEKIVAFEAALDKLDVQLRKAADRRKSRRGLRGADVDLGLLDLLMPREDAAGVAAEAGPREVRRIAGIEVAGDGPMVVREKVFETTPLTLAQALDEMELVGHDFFLYVDAETDAPSVVYRRKAYDYGIIHLKVVR